MLVQDGAAGPTATLVQYLDYGRHGYGACHLPPSYAAWFIRLLDGSAIGGSRQITLATGLDRRATVSNLIDMPRFDMARLLVRRSEEHTSELQSLMRISYAVFCLKKKTDTPRNSTYNTYKCHTTIT